MTIEKIKKLEEKELKKILKKYTIDKEDEEKILNSLKEGYFNYWKTAIILRVLESILKENNIQIKMKDFGERCKEEAKKYPFK